METKPQCIRRNVSLHLPNLFCLLFLVAVTVVAASPSDIVIDAQLDYATFRGAYSASLNITYWKTLPFAAPPVGENRFRAPQPVVSFVNKSLSESSPESPYDCSRPFPMCPQREGSGDEDCLYLGLYGRPWTEADQRAKRLRPVVVVFYGGGFIRGSAELSLPPSAYPVLNVSTSPDKWNDVLFVYPNYRTNVFGFLPGKEVGDDAHSDTNAGLLDQQAALRWVQTYIHLFGGDAGNVTIWGQSAGGGSVVAQVVAQGSRGEDETKNSGLLFHRAMASSPYWPKTHRYNSTESQKIYDDLVRRVGCDRNKTGTYKTTSSTLACLKALDVQTLRNVSLTMTDDREATATSSYVWAPVLDDSFLRQPLSSLGKMNLTKHIGLTSAFATYNTHEGENFVPTYLFPKTAVNKTKEEDETLFHTWLVRYLPDLTQDDAIQVDRLYPETGDIEDPDDSNSTSPYAAYTSDDPFKRAGLVYRDVTLACPAFWMTGLAPPDKSWLAEYSISPAKHASDTYWWNTVNKYQKADRLHYSGYAGALASFFATGDPNKNKLTASSVQGSPDLQSGREWTITSSGFSTKSLAQLQKRCDFWLSISPRISI